MTIIYFLLVLTIVIMVHEFGHFLCAKRNGVHIYEFSMGMGPKIFSKVKNNIEYSIRLFPIGGFVSMAGEDMESADIPKDKQLCHKSLWIRFKTMAAGVTFNILLAIILLFIIALIRGVPVNNNKVVSVDNENTSIKVGDKILEVNDVVVKNNEDVSLELAISKNNEAYLKVKHADNSIEKVKIKAKKEKKKYVYGIKLDKTKKRGFIKSITYAFTQTGNLIKQILKTLKYLITGKIKLNNLSGPVGIYLIVDEVAQDGFLNVLYLIAYLCINVAVINILPFPAFDGGRILFLLIEKITGKKVSEKIENKIHIVGFILLMILMVFITYNDILKIVK